MSWPKLTPPNDWRKPARCDTGNCIEVRRNILSDILVRSGELGDAGMLAATPAEFAAFIAAAKAGEYDDLCQP